MGAYKDVLAELESKQKNNVNSEVKSTKSKKPINTQSKEPANDQSKKSLPTINVYFLGSCHYAYKHPNAGTPFNNNKHVYFKEKKKKRTKRVVILKFISHFPALQLLIQKNQP